MEWVLCHSHCVKVRYGVCVVTLTVLRLGMECVLSLSLC